MDQIENNPNLVKCQGRCKQYLPREAFYKNRSRENGLQLFCKECTKRAVENYEKKKKSGLSSKLPCVNFSICGQKRNRNSPGGKCGDCRHRERMRAKYNANPTYYKVKHASWSKRRAAINKEIENEELELINHGIHLTKSEMLLLTQFKDSTWIPEKLINPRKLFTEDLQPLLELGLIKVKRSDNSVEYALTEKGLEFLGITPLEERQ